MYFSIRILKRFAGYIKVKKNLADPAKSHLTLLDIAFDAGFNSKSSFNVIFKKQMNLTPSEHRKQVIGKKT